MHYITPVDSEIIKFIWEIDLKLGEEIWFIHLAI